MATITDFPAPGVPETEIEPEENQPNATTPATSAPKPSQKLRGRPAKGQSPPPERKEPAFFEKVAAVPKDDWGTRAFMYVYCEEPVCVPKTWGETRYMLRSNKPIHDVEELKQQYGSFKGWLSLNLRKSGKDGTDQVDRHQFEIFDPLAPPKIPKAAWANDARNKRWEALIPPEPPSPTQAAASFQEAIGVYKGIVADVKTELKGDQTEQPAPTDATKSTLETLKLAKEIFGPAAGTTDKTDPFDLAGKIMAMRSNDPMIALLMARMDAQDKALEASRAREFELQKEVLNARTQPAAATNGAGKDFFTQLMEFGGEKMKERLVNGIFGGGATETVTRAARTTTLDFIRETIPQIIQSPIGNGLGIWLSSLATRQNGTPAPAMNVNPAMQPNLQTPGNPPTVETEEQRLNRIATQIATPMIVEFFEVWARTGDPGNSGDSFGMRVNDMWPSDFEYLQGIGAERICSMMLSHHMAGPRLRPQEQKFRQFVAEFLAYDAGDEEPIAPAGPPPAAGARSRIIDVEEEGA